jgi:hypothetical protein
VRRHSRLAKRALSVEAPPWTLDTKDTGCCKIDFLKAPGAQEFRII